MHKSFIYGRRYPIFLLSGLLGLILGAFAAAGTDDSLLSLMRLTAVSPVSIVVLFSVSALPFLIAAYAVSIDQWNILFSVAFCRFFCWAFCAVGVIRCFGTAAWLIQPLLQLTDNVTLLLFGIFAVRWFGCRNGTKREIFYALVFIALTVIIDYCFAAPFLAKLFDSELGRYAYSCWI